MMNRFLFIASLLMVLFSCSSAKKMGAPDFVVVQDTETKVLKGILSRSLIENDTSFAWFKENMQYGRVDETAAAIFRQKSGQFSILVFGGTWCHDTENLLPKFYRLVDRSGIPANLVTLIGVDRQKKTLHNLQIKWNVTHTPTFIIVKNGKEFGRVVEYGTTGDIEKELGEIVARL